MYSLVNMNVNKSAWSNKDIVFYKSSVQFNYFEKSKYQSYMVDSLSSNNNNSFVWQKWVRSLSDRKDYYEEKRSSYLKYIEVNYPNINLDLSNSRKFNRVNSKVGAYQLVNVSNNNNFKRKRANFFTYRKFRFNQLRLFYTTCNQRQFKNLYNNYNYIKKSVLDHFLLSLEGRLEFFLLRTNFFPSKYFIRQFISHHGVLVNGYRVNNKNYLLKPWDIVSISSKNYLSIFNSLKNSLTFINFKSNFFDLDSSSLKVNKSLFKKFSVLNISPLLSINFMLNYPRYIEVDYVLLEAMFIRYPSLKELNLPIDSEINPENRSFYKL